MSQALGRNQLCSLWESGHESLLNINFIPCDQEWFFLYICILGWLVNNNKPNIWKMCFVLPFSDLRKSLSVFVLWRKICNILNLTAERIKPSVCSLSSFLRDKTFYGLVRTPSVGYCNGFSSLTQWTTLFSYVLGLCFWRGSAKWAEKLGLGPKHYSRGLEHWIYSGYQYGQLFGIRSVLKSWKLQMVCIKGSLYVWFIIVCFSRSEPWGARSHDT